MVSKKIISLTEYLKFSEYNEIYDFILIFDSSDQDAEELLRNGLANGKFNKFGLFISTGSNAQLFEDIVDSYLEDKYLQTQNKNWLLPTVSEKDVHEVAILANAWNSEKIVIYSKGSDLRKEIEVLT